MSGIISDNLGRSSGLLKSAGGGDFVKLGAVTASGSSTVAFDGLYTSAYNIYKIYGSKLLPATNSQDLTYQVNISNSAHSTAEYVYGSGKSYIDTSPTHYWTTGMASDFDNPHTAVTLSNDTQLWDAYHAGTFEMTIYDPLSTAAWKIIDTRWSFSDASFQSYYNNLLVKNTAANTGVTIKYASGNVASGVFTLYGLTV